MNAWLHTQMSKRITAAVNQWMNASVHEIMHQWNEWMNECMHAQMHKQITWWYDAPTNQFNNGWVAQCTSEARMDRMNHWTHRGIRSLNARWNELTNERKMREIKASMHKWVDERMNERMNEVKRGRLSRGDRSHDCGPSDPFNDHKSLYACAVPKTMRGCTQEASTDPNLGSALTW